MLICRDLGAAGSPMSRNYSAISFLRHHAALKKLVKVRVLVLQTANTFSLGDAMIRKSKKTDSFDGPGLCDMRAFHVRARNVPYGKFEEYVRGGFLCPEDLERESERCALMEGITAWLPVPARVVRNFNRRKIYALQALVSLNPGS